MRTLLIIALTFVIALALSILPMPGWIKWLRPEWVALVLIYWVIALPHRIGLWIAWSLGLLMDVLHNSLLGENAIALSLIAYISVLFYRRIRMFPIWQQALVVMGLIMLKQLLSALIQALIYNPPNSWLYIMPSLMSLLLWPWLFVLLRGVRRQFNLY